jgi:hypothetical protein
VVGEIDGDDVAASGAAGDELVVGAVSETARPVAGIDSGHVEAENLPTGTGVPDAHHSRNPVTQGSHRLSVRAEHDEREVLVGHLTEVTCAAGILDVPKQAAANSYEPLRV